MWLLSVTKSLSTLKIKELVIQSCPTLCNPMNCSPPGSSVHEIPQTGILEWVAIPFSRRSSWTRPPALQADSLPFEPPGNLDPRLFSNRGKHVLISFCGNPVKERSWVNVLCKLWRTDQTCSLPSGLYLFLFLSQHSTLFTAKCYVPATLSMQLPKNTLLFFILCLPGVLVILSQPGKVFLIFKFQWKCWRLQNPSLLTPPISPHPTGLEASSVLLSAFCISL